MKQYLGLLLVPGFILIFEGCKKENTKEQEISSLFTNTEWTGEIKYSGTPFAEPYSIEFFQGGSLKWHQVTGDYDGIYTIDDANRKITLLSMAGNGIVTATVTQDNKLSTISPTNIFGCESNRSGQLDLDNTTWKGKWDNTFTFEMIFKTGKKVKITGIGGPLPELSYQRAGAAVLAIDNADKYFCVIQPDNKTIKGIYYYPLFPSSYHSIELTKQ